MSKFQPSWLNNDDEAIDDEVDMDEYDSEITGDDYVFILDSDGNLKSVLVPEDYEEIPESVLAIFEVFGITDEDEVNARLGHTLH